MRALLISIAFISCLNAFSDKCTPDGWCPTDIKPPPPAYGFLSRVFVQPDQSVQVFGRDHLHRFSEGEWKSLPLDPQAPWTEPYVVTRIGDLDVRAQSFSFYYRAEIQTRKNWSEPWSKLTELTAIHLGDLWGSSAKDLYLSAGDLNEIHHFDGSRWENLYDSKKISGDRIAGTSPEHVWIAGGSAIHRFENGKWNLLVLPFTREESFGVTALWTDRPGHGFVSATVDRRPQGVPQPTVLVYEIDGDKLTSFDLKTTQQIKAFAGSSREDLYAVGGWEHQFVSGVESIVVIPAYGYVTHFDGKSWKEELSGIGKKSSPVKVPINPERLPGEGGTILPSEPLVDVAYNPATKMLWAISPYRAVFKKLR